MAQFCFGGQEFVALREGALYWRERRALVVADLHFEKASWFARRGQMLPPYDSVATLEALEALVAAHAVEEVWALGDSFHDAEGPGRLPGGIAERLSALVSATRWTWITGNHDSDSAGTLGGYVAEEAAVDGIILRHRAEAHDARPELSGHYHPKWRVGGRGRGRGGGRAVSRRCFVHGASRVILPAFGALAGGLDAAAAPIRALAGPTACALIPVPGALLRFPIR